MAGSSGKAVKAKMLSVEVDAELARELDDLLSKARIKLYSSRSEFLKDAIRKNMDHLIKFYAELQTNKSLRSIHEGAKEFAAKAKARGWDGKLLSKEEKDLIAREFVREHNISLIKE